MAHDCFRSLTVTDLDRFYSRQSQKVRIDIKAMLDRAALERAGYIVWRL